MKSHQLRVVSAITLAQQVPAAGLIQYFTVEGHYALKRLLATAFSIGSVSSGYEFVIETLPHDTVASISE